MRFYKHNHLKIWIKKFNKIFKMTERFIKVTIDIVLTNKLLVLEY